MATGDLDKLVLDVENGLYPTGFGREPTGSNIKWKHADEPVQVCIFIFNLDTFSYQ